MHMYSLWVVFINIYLKYHETVVSSAVNVICSYNLHVITISKKRATKSTGKSEDFFLILMMKHMYADVCVYIYI